MVEDTILQDQECNCAEEKDRLCLLMLVLKIAVMMAMSLPELCFKAIHAIMTDQHSNMHVLQLFTSCFIKLSSFNLHNENIWLRCPVRSRRSSLSPAQFSFSFTTTSGRRSFHHGHSHSRDAKTLVRPPMWHPRGLLIGPVPCPWWDCLSGGPCCSWQVLPLASRQSLRLEMAWPDTGSHIACGPGLTRTTWSPRLPEPP